MEYVIVLKYLFNVLKEFHKVNINYWSNKSESLHDVFLFYYYRMLKTSRLIVGTWNKKYQLKVRDFYSCFTFNCDKKNWEQHYLPLLL